MYIHDYGFGLWLANLLRVKSCIVLVRSKAKTILAVYGLLVFLCFPGISCTNSYEHRVKNIGSRMVSELEIESNGRSFGHGYVSPGTHSGYSGSFRIKKHEMVKIRWKTYEGKIIFKEVFIKKNHMFTTPVFVLDDKGLVVKYE